MTTSALMIAFHDGGGEAATFTSSVAAQSGYPLTNLQNSRLFARFRGAAGSLSGVTISADNGFATSMNVWALFGTNLSATATRRLQAGNDVTFATNLVDSATANAFDASLGSLLTVVPPWGRSVIYVAPTSKVCRYVRFTLTDAGNGDNFLEAGIFRYGVGWQPGRSFDESWRSYDELLGPSGAQKIIRHHELTLAAPTQAEAYQLATLARGLLTTRRVLVLPNPLDTAAYSADAIWCVLADVYERRVRFTASGSVYPITLHFREVDE